MHWPCCINGLPPQSVRPALQNEPQSRRIDSGEWSGGLQSPASSRQPEKQLAATDRDYTRLLHLIVLLNNLPQTGNLFLLIGDLGSLLILGQTHQNYQKSPWSSTGLSLTRFGLLLLPPSEKLVLLHPTGDHRPQRHGQQIEAANKAPSCPLRVPPSRAEDGIHLTEPCPPPSPGPRVYHPRKDP